VENRVNPVFDMSTSTTTTTDDLNAYAFGSSYGPCQSKSLDFQGPPCYVAFGDTNSGCTTDLEDAISSMTLCAPGSNESFVNETFRTKGIVLPTCKCMPIGSFDSREDNMKNRVVAAVEFTSSFRVLEENDYTIRTENPQISKEDIFSPFIAPPSTTTEFMYSGFTTIQTAIDMAILNRTITVGLSTFPRVGYTDWIPGALMNVPFFFFLALAHSLTLNHPHPHTQQIPLYLTIAMMFSVSGITTQIAEEGTKKLRHGLFMQGLSPRVYWASWFFVLFVRTMMTILIMFLITVTLLIEHMDALFFFIGFSSFGIFACNASIFIGMRQVKAKTASNMIILVPAVISALTYSYTAVLNSRSAEAPFPNWLTQLLSFTLPPFSFSMFCTNLLVLNNEQDGGMGWHNINVESRLGISPLYSLLGILVGTMLLAFYNIYDMIKSTGIVFTSSLEPRRVAPSSTNSNEAVKIQNLHKHFNLGGGRTTRAVNGLSCSFYSNAINVFLGANGSGKSTTISVLTGLYKPTDGDARIDGLSVKTHMQHLRRQIGVCSQDNVLWDLLTVREHLNVFAAIRDVKKGKIEEDHVESLLCDVGLRASSDVLSKNLSGGQKRKLMIAIALIGDPKVVFLDEPTAGVDARAYVVEVFLSLSLSLLFSFSKGNTQHTQTNKQPTRDMGTSIQKKGSSYARRSPWFTKDNTP